MSQGNLQELPGEIDVIDSHTGGEPTRVIVSGGPDLGSGTLFERRKRFKSEFDHFRSAVINEPRGSEAMVGALLCEPTNPEYTAATIYFHNTSYIGMCGHGTIGLLVTLLHMGRIREGEHLLETPVGVVKTTVHDSTTVTVQNVASYRTSTNVAVDVAGLGRIVGDIAWGGNWFFLVREHSETIAAQNIERLSSVSKQIRRALVESGILAPDGSELDHIELFGPADPKIADSKNFVLCPGGSYDRSPCGTGTSAKLACLASDGLLAPGKIWRQESIIGSVFEASYQPLDDAKIVPSIKGQAYISGHTKLLIDPRDPFRRGIRI